VSIEMIPRTSREMPALLSLALILIL